MRRNLLRSVIIFGSIIFGACATAFAADTSSISAGDTAWVLTASALVLLMTAPGLGLFYAGMVRRKNVLATLMQSFILAALVSVQWALYGIAWRSLPGAR